MYLTAVIDWPEGATAGGIVVRPDSVTLGEPVFVELAGITAPPDSLGLPARLGFVLIR